MARRRRWLILIGSILVATAAAIITLLVVADVGRYRTVLEDRMGRAIGREVSIGELRLRLSPFAIDALDVGIREDPAFADDDFARFGALRMRVRLRPLLQRELSVTSLQLIEPDIRLRRNREGVWNVSTLRVPERDDPGILVAAAVSDLTVSTGRVEVIDLTPPTPHAMYEIHSLAARNLSADSSFPFKLSFSPPGVVHPIAVEGEAGPFESPSLQGIRAEGSFETPSAQIAETLLGDVSGRFRLRQGLLAGDPIEFLLHDRRQQASAVLDLTDGATLTIDARLSGLDAARLLSGRAAEEDTLRGILDTQFSVVTSTPFTGFADDLRGRASVSLHDGRISHVAFGREIAAAAGLGGLELFQRQTPLRSAIGSFALEGLSATTDDLRIETPEAVLLCRGRVAPDGRLDFSVVATFVPEVSEQLKAHISSRSIVGLVTRALLLDDEGRIVIPARVTGTFFEPRFAVDLPEVPLLRDRGTRPLDSIIELFRRRIPGSSGRE
jgi:hypothetical protein